MRRLLGQTLLAANSLKPRNVIKWCRYSRRAWMGKEKYCSFRSVELLLLGISCGIWRMLITSAALFLNYFFYFPSLLWPILSIFCFHRAMNQELNLSLLSTFFLGLMKGRGFHKEHQIIFFFRLNQQFYSQWLLEVTGVFSCLFLSY